MEYSNLVDYVVDQAQYDFEWGVRDCVLFVAGGFKVHNNIDILQDIEPWSNEEEAVVTIKSLGDNLLEACERILPSLGAVKVDTPKRGDLAVYKTPTDYTFFICMDNRTMCCLGSKGVVYIEAKGTFWGVR